MLRNYDGPVFAGLFTIGTIRLGFTLCFPRGRPYTSVLGGGCPITALNSVQFAMPAA